MLGFVFSVLTTSSPRSSRFSMWRRPWGRGRARDSQDSQGQSVLPERRAESFEERVEEGSSSLHFAVP